MFYGRNDTGLSFEKLRLAFTHCSVASLAHAVSLLQTTFGYPKFVYLNIKEQTRRLIMSKYFNNFFLLCILINTVLLAIEYNGMPKDMASALSDINFVLTQIFTLEVVLKVMKP